MVGIFTEVEVSDQLAGKEGIFPSEAFKRVYDEDPEVLKLKSTKEESLFEEITSKTKVAF